MFLEKDRKIFKELPNPFCTADDIYLQGMTMTALIISKCYIHNTNMQKKLKLNKQKCCFRCITIPLFGEIISKYHVN